MQFKIHMYYSGFRSYDHTDLVHDQIDIFHMTDKDTDIRSNAVPYLKLTEFAINSACSTLCKIVFIESKKRSYAT